MFFFLFFLQLQLQPFFQFLSLACLCITLENLVHSDLSLVMFFRFYIKYSSILTGRVYFFLSEYCYGFSGIWKQSVIPPKVVFNMYSQHVSYWSSSCIFHFSAEWYFHAVSEYIPIFLEWIFWIIFQVVFYGLYQVLLFELLLISVLNNCMLIHF